MKFKFRIFSSLLIVICLLAVNMVIPTKAEALDNTYFDETYRPQIKYTAETPGNIINDPNGLLYYGGEYHLFHQYNLWGQVHWGHAVSTDLVHWTPLQPAIFPDNIGQIWSGSAVVDWNNTSGLQTGNEKVLVALFTYSSHVDGTQSQGLAYSNDKGRTWTMHPNNPILPNQGIKDFRDPKVFWHEQTKKWVMVLVENDHIITYTSPNLITWTKGEPFGVGEGAHGGVWECPDLFPMNVDGNPNNTKWVLSVSVIKGAPAGGTGMQYFVGDFDGTKFTNSNSPDTVLWQNYGSDYYAGVTWNDIPSTDGRRLMIAWSDNWNYRDKLPTNPFLGQLSLVHELQLKNTGEGIRLTHQPIAKYKDQRGTGDIWANQTITPTTNLLSSKSGDVLELEAQFDVNTATASEFGFKVRTGSGGEYTTIGYNRSTSKLFIDRTNSGLKPTDNFTGIHEAPLAPDNNGKVKIRALVDRSSVEVFGNDGKVSLSDLIFPDRNSVGLATYAVDGNVTLDTMNFYPMNKIWGSTPFTSTNLSGWTTVRGNWADTINGKGGESETDGFMMTSNTGSDFTYSSDINISNYRGQAAASLVFRANETATFGYVANISASGDSVRLFKFNGDGTSTTLGSYNTTINTNTNYNLKVVTAGSNIKVYLDNSLLIDVNDSSYSTGYVGLNVFNSLSYFKNVNLTNAKNFNTNLTGWSTLQGTWSESSNGKIGNSSGDAILLANESASDFIYEGKIKVSESTGGKGAGALVFRSNADASQAYVMNVDALNDCVTLFKFGNGGGEIAKVIKTIDTDKEYNLKVIASGSNIRAYLDNVEVINATDTTYSSGRFGMLAWNSTTTFQDIKYAKTPSGWTSTAGTWSDVTYGKQGSASGDGFLMSTNTGANFTYQADINIDGASGGAAGSLVFRSNADASQAYVVNVDALNDSVTFFKFGNGGGTIGKYSYSIDNNRTYQLRVEAVGSNFKIYLDGTLVINANDSTYTSGQFGLNVWNSSTSFANVKYWE